ncbi:sensor histidine kinase [Clostridium thailandense]|uniref:histidine kinase n=1 Tax=Clostridium thailandense TaxID=2794346 RepID=A0A949TWZ5_9CLOT|nr:sensor histidine kinase [Clostridium thailandense]MBV7271979.1 sensor histidine kinase [Clostridium thailandense]
MNNTNKNVSNINEIINKIIDEIGLSREQILNIVDNVRSEQENLIFELSQVRCDIDKTIKEVDMLEKKDKLMRRILVDVSKNFSIYDENKIKAAYQEASDIRAKFMTKVNEEKMLRKRRLQLEISLKKSMENIENAEKIINRMGIALNYLEGNILSILEDVDKRAEMFIGIKVLEAQENERERIARDIHDGPAQHMASAIMKVDICKMVIQKNLDEGLKDLEELKENVKSALKEVRNIIFDLRPMSLEELDLNEAIEQTIRSIVKETNIELQLKLKSIRSEIEPIIQVAVYRIIQEAFNNIKKHSKAKCAQVKLDFGTKYLTLIISDDGIGFNVEETLKKVRAQGGSYGLIGIFDRVNQLQGKIKIKSSQESGTVYNVELPVNREVFKDEKKNN